MNIEPYLFTTKKQKLFSSLNHEILDWVQSLLKYQASILIALAPKDMVLVIPLLAAAVARTGEINLEEQKRGC